MLIKMMQWSGIIVVSVSLTDGQQKVFLHFIEEAMFNSTVLYTKRGGKKRFL